MTLLTFFQFLTPLEYCERLKKSLEGRKKTVMILNNNIIEYIYLVEALTLMKLSMPLKGRFYFGVLISLLANVIISLSYLLRLS